MAQHIDANYEAAIPDFLERGLYWPVQVDITPLEQLRKSLDQLSTSLAIEQICRIKNIVLKMGRYAIKDAYLMQNGHLMTTCVAGRNYQGIVKELTNIIPHIPMKPELKTNISALKTMFPFAFMSCSGNTNNSKVSLCPNNTDLDRCYAAFDALEKDINSQ